MSSFKKFIQKNGNGLSTFSLDQLKEEVIKRDRSPNVFPLDVFNNKLKPFIEALNNSNSYDIPASFIGLALLSAYSTAIGTAYVITTNNRDQFYLPVWGALTGISSSGKTLALSQVYEPLERLQNKFDQQWEEKTANLSAEKMNYCKLDTVVYRDAHIPTLVKSVLPDNPKGLVKMNDELLEWINGMNQLSKKEGTDEQFWISSWSGKSYSGIRSGKQKFVIRKPFVNVVGGAQYSILYKFFSKDRDTTGFIFRLLFALPDVDKIAEPNAKYEMPKGYYQIYEQSIVKLYEGLPVDHAEDEPNKCILTEDAVNFYQAWVKEKITFINRINDLDERDIHSGILGKIKEYALRFAAILHLADVAINQHDLKLYTTFKPLEPVTKDTMIRAVKCAEYFYKSAVEVYDKVQVSMTAPPEVLICATLMKLGRSASEIGEALYGSRDEKFRLKAWRQTKKWIKEYPKVFNAMAR